MTSKLDRKETNFWNKRLDHQEIRNSIESFNPGISHYRREQVPNRRYLQSDTSIEIMHDDFLQNHSNSQCSYIVYREEVSQKIIICFATLGEEECEPCLAYKINMNLKKLVKLAKITRKQLSCQDKNIKKQRI